MNETKRPPDAGEGPPRDETAEMLAVEAFLRAHDPAMAYPDGFDEARRRRLLRYMRHPRLALLLLHHRTAAILGAAALVAVVALALYWLVREAPADPLLSILIRPAPVEAPAPPLEPVPPAEDPTDRAEPLPFDPEVAAPPGFEDDEGFDDGAYDDEEEFEPEEPAFEGVGEW